MSPLSRRCTLKHHPRNFHAISPPTHTKTGLLSLGPPILKNALDGWLGERWLNTNIYNVRSFMRRGLDLATDKGCDGVDPDNIDAYDNENPFVMSNSNLPNESHFEEPCVFLVIMTHMTHQDLPPNRTPDTRVRQ